MDVFRKNYSVYYSLMCVTGLWPFTQSTLTTVQRIFSPLFTFCCIVIQVLSIRNVEISLDTLLVMLSYTCPMALFLLRYLGFVVNFPLLRTVFQGVQNDLITFKEPEESRIFMKYVDESKRVILMFLGLSCTGILLIASTTLLPTVMQPKYQPYWLRFYGFFYSEQSMQTNWACMHMAVASMFGLLTLACTEGSLAVFSLYLCGLFEITSYRIRNAINDAAMSGNSRPVILGPSLRIHRQALEYGIFTQISCVTTKLVGNMMLSYLLAILMVIVSFAVNLYRFFLAVLEMDKIDNVIISFEFVLVHVIIMFLNNYSGQRLLSTSSQVFNGIYNSLWYCTPPKSQKMLLFVLMKSSVDVQFNLAGLFVPCYEGFSMMISSSFSYFTVIYSMK